MASNSKCTNDDFQISTNSQNQDGNKCSICLNQIKEDTDKQLSGKCQICLDKIKAVPSGFPFVLAGEEINEFECPICSLLIRNATELKCEHLFCEDCLTYYEKDQLTKDGDVKFFCPVCQAEYKSREKFNVRSTDKVIQTSLRVKCLQKECEWTGCIKDYKNHSKKCEFLEVDCPNKGCIYQVNAKEMEEHLRVCFYRQVECEYCNKECSFTQLKEHYNNCEGYPIPCNNLGCPDNIQRSLMEDHLENCEFAIVSCPFLAFGCTEKIQRRDIEDHIGKAKSSHDTLLFQMVYKMKHENEERDQKIQQQDLRIEELENIVTKNEEEIKELQNNSIQQKASITKDLLALTDKNQSIEDSLIKTNSMTSNMNKNVIGINSRFERYEKTAAETDEITKEQLQQLKSLQKSNEKAVKVLEPKVNKIDAKLKKLEESKWTDRVKIMEKQLSEAIQKEKACKTEILQHTKDIDILKTFALKMVWLQHFTCNLHQHYRRPSYLTTHLFKHNFDQHEDVKNWSLVKAESTTSKNDSDFLICLANLYNNFSTIIFPDTYAERWLKLTKIMRDGELFAGLGAMFVRVYCLALSNHIQVTVSNEVFPFKEPCYRHSMFVATLKLNPFVVKVIANPPKTIRLLHPFVEEKSIFLNNGITESLNEFKLDTESGMLYNYEEYLLQIEF